MVQCGEDFTRRTRGAGSEKTFEVVLGTFNSCLGAAFRISQNVTYFRVSHGARAAKRTLEDLLPLSSLLPTGGVTSDKSLNHALLAKKEGLGMIET